MDKIISDLIKRENKRQHEVVNLIASENYTIKDVLSFNGSSLTNKYAEGYPGKRYYSGCSVVDQVENIAIDRAKALFGAEHANVQPHSGTQANAAAYLALLDPHDTILALELDHGGHLSHGLSINFSGIFYNFVSYKLDPKTNQLDYDAIDKACAKHKPKLLLCGYSVYSRKIDFKRFKEIADKHNAYLMADIAHIAGLVAAKVHPSPVPYADVVTSTTHKSLCGPRSGLILCKKEIAKKIDRAVFPGIQGGPHMHTIAAKAACFLNALSSDFVEYQSQVLKNSAHFANYMMKKGYSIVANGSENHLFLINILKSKNLTGKQAADILETIDVICNKNLIPYDEKSPFVTSGIRFGVYATTSLGFVEEDYTVLADIIDAALSNPDDIAKHQSLKKEIKLLLNKYQHNFKKYYLV